MLSWPHIIKIKFNGTTIYDKNDINNNLHFKEIEKILCNNTGIVKGILTTEVLPNER